MATVVVLGDIGRSPRMQYHACSLAEAGFPVDIVGYQQTSPMRAILDNPAISIHAVPEFPINLPRILFPVYAPFKILWLFFQLFFRLLFVRRPQFYLVQNPPSVPALFAVRIAALLRGARMIIDWHNFGYTILRLGLPRPLRPLATLYQWYEKFWGRRAHANFCVTRAMQAELQQWGITARVLYDRSPSYFGIPSLETKHDLFLRENDSFRGVADTMGIQLDCGDTLFTRQVARNKVALRPDRPGLLVSSTSWTADEDFGILLRALRRVDEVAKARHVAGGTFPHLVIAITGKGPLREYYEAQMAAEPFQIC